VAHISRFGATPSPEVPRDEKACSPKISVIMANHQGEQHIQEAVHSVLAQTHRNLELVVADDGSTDESVAIVRDLAQRDPRIRLLTLPEQLGAGGARNRALEACTGSWVAIMDSDDVLHPDRLRRLLHAAEATHADAVSDDLVYFSEVPGAAGRTHLQALALSSRRTIVEADLVLSTLGRRDLPPLGYLKPLVRKSALLNLRYNEDLPIGEDYELYLKLLRTGVRFEVVPEALYLYRRHSGSTSHRLTRQAIASMLAADAAAEHLVGETTADHYAARKLMLTRWLEFSELVDDLKRGRVAGALGRVVRTPSLAAELIRSVRERAARLRGSGRRRSSQRLMIGASGFRAPAALSRTRFLPVPEVGQDTGPEATRTWALLSKEASRTSLHLIAVGNTGLSAAWRVRPLEKLTVLDDPRDPVRLPLPLGAVVVPMSDHPSLT
jgi:succinoglycan biosynthesis protein ExoO